MFSGRKTVMSKDKLNGPEGAPLVGSYDLTPLAALPPPEYLLQASLLYSDALNGLHTLRPPLLSRRTRRAFVGRRRARARRRRKKKTAGTSRCGRWSS